MRNCAVFLVLLHCGALVAQTVRVPFVGCAATGQVAVEAPNGRDKVVRISAGAAQGLAYYMEAFRGTGVLAPRGWYCIGLIGSSGSDLFVTAEPLKGTDVFSRDGEIAGPAVELEYISGDNGSGRFDIAQVLARVFPAQRPFVKQVMDSLDQPTRWFPFGPYPNDKLIVQTDRLVEFQTPPRSEGLGSSDTRLKANDDPIDGVAIFDGPAPRHLPSLQILRVRLPRELDKLTSSIIHEFERR